MPKFLISFIGWIYLAIVLDWYRKKIVGWNILLRGRAAEWKQALDMEIPYEFPGGVRVSLSPLTLTPPGNS